MHVIQYLDDDGMRKAVSVELSAVRATLERLRSQHPGKAFYICSSGLHEKLQKADEFWLSQGAA